MEIKSQNIYECIEVDDIDENPVKSDKKANNILVKFIINMLLTLSVIAIGWSTFSLVSYCWKDTSQQDKIKQLYTLNETNFYYQEGGKPIVSNMIEFVESLPESIKNTFYNDWIVDFDESMPTVLVSGLYIVNSNEYDTSGMILGGYTFTRPRIIYINSRLSEDAVYSAFVHEMGHFVSFEYGSQHGSKEWTQIYSKGNETLDVSEYDKSNVAEFFASCFELYYNEREKLEVYLPEAIVYFDNLLLKQINHETFIDKFYIGCINTINILRSYANRFL